LSRTIIIKNQAKIDVESGKEGGDEGRREHGR
jgi:hypothetical protein